jgi:hypothetical protein
VRSPFCMNWCLEPGKGPSNPALRKQRIKSLRLIGPKGGTPLYELLYVYPANSGNTKVL